jgi:ParB-like chromosome segregation protein Spo0J
MVVRKGNGRLAAALELGWSHVAAIVLDEEDARAVARAIADNRSSDLALWDDEVLARHLQTLRDTGHPTGYAPAEVDALVASALEPGGHDGAQPKDAEREVECPSCGTKFPI